MGRAHVPAAQRQGADGPGGPPQRLDQPSGSDDVGDRIPVGQLVKMHGLDRHAVDLRLGLGEEGQDRDGALADRLVEGARPQPVADRAEGTARMSVVIRPQP